MNIHLILLFLLCTFIIPIKLKADHAMSMDIKLQCIDFSQKKYKVIVNAYYDCGGISPVGNMTINFNPEHPNHSTDPAERCVMLEVELLLTNITYNVLPLCNNLPQECGNAGSPGINKYTYEGEVYLNCDSDFEIIGHVCCRSASFTNIFDSEYTILSSKTYLHHTDIYCNNTPSFNSLPVAKFCSGQLATYNLECFDIDGDSLVYELAIPYTHFGYPTVRFIHGFDYNNPVPIEAQTTFNLNSSTGEINFYPLQGIIQNAVVGIMIYEYRDGQLIGQYIRELIFNILATCDNTLPIFETLTINGRVQNTTEIIVCDNEDLNLDFTYTDIDTNQILTINQNLNNIFPNAQITHTGTNPLILSVFIPASNLILDEYNFSTKIQDNACPINGFNTKSFKIKKQHIDITTISNQSICEGENVVLYLDVNSNSNYSYYWQTHQDLSCTNCNYTTVSPLQNTTYRGFININHCQKIVDINVIVNPLPNINLVSNVVDNNIYFSWNQDNDIVSYNLIINNMPAILSNDNNLNFLDLANDTCISLEVQALNINGCISTENLLTCSPICYRQITSINTPIICVGESIQLELSEDFMSYLWSNNATTNTIITDGTTNHYNVTVTDNNACEYIYPFIINYAIAINPNISVQNESSTNAMDGTIIIDLPNSLSQNQYSLNGGAFQTNNIFENLISGTYHLNIKDEYNCLWDTTLEITSYPEIITPKMPTAFSPNGDGEHDVFRPINLPNIYIKSFKIYNRWGSLLLDEKINFAWDGKFKDEMQSRDIYIYVLEYQTPTDNSIQILRGEFLLIR